ncbi:MAG: GNAT family N-acetyltransferase [Bryobacteraceae bacterium]
MVVEPIETLAELESLVPEWDLLWERSPAAMPFQHPGWLLAWRKVFTGGQLFTFAVRNDTSLVALAPMFLHEWKGRRQVTFLGNGVSDHLDILVEPGMAQPAWAAILQVLAEQRHRWDVCDLQDLDENAPLVCSATCSPLGSAVKPQYFCSSVTLPESAEAFHAALPHGLRRNLRRYRTRLEQQGAITFETAHASNFQDHLDALFALHRARWREKDEAGMLESPELECFHRSAARGLWDRGLVRLHTLRLDDRIVAVVYAFVHAQRAYSYLGGFDPALARFSPGALIMGYTIEQAIREGVTEFDFLRGRESYKADWGAKPAVSSRLVLWHDKRPVDLLELPMQ